MSRMIKVIFITLALFCKCQASWILTMETTPDYVSYNRIFAKFNKYIHVVDAVDTNQIYPFETLMFALWYNSPANTRFFLKITYNDQIFGFALCQLITPTHVMVRQFVMDPDVFNGSLLGGLLMQCLAFMPQVTQISVLCPSTFSATIAALEYMGFSLNGDADFPVAGIYQQWDLSLRSKCAICDVLYPPDFWQQPVDMDDQDECEDEE